jgi:hypothetical protein
MVGSDSVGQALAISTPAHNDRYVVEGFDVSNAFYGFQCAVNHKIEQGGILTLESHVQHILALSSIFFSKTSAFT